MSDVVLGLVLAGIGAALLALSLTVIWFGERDERQKARIFRLEANLHEEQARVGRRDNEIEELLARLDEARKGIAALKPASSQTPAVPGEEG